MFYTNLLYFLLFVIIQASYCAVLSPLSIPGNDFFITSHVKIISLDNSVYILNSSGDIYEYRENRIKEICLTDCSPNENANSIIKAKNGSDIWVGTNLRGIGTIVEGVFKYTNQTIPCYNSSADNIPSEDENSIQLHGFDQNGNLWFTELIAYDHIAGTGLCVTDFDTCTFLNRENNRYTANNAYFVLFNKSNDVFVGAVDDESVDVSINFYVYKLQNDGDISKISVIDDSLYSSVEDGGVDSEGNLWVVEKNSLVKISNEGNLIYTIPDTLGLPKCMVIENDTTYMVTGNSEMEDTVRVISFFNGQFFCLAKTEQKYQIINSSISIDSTGEFWVGLDKDIVVTTHNTDNVSAKINTQIKKVAKPQSIKVNQKNNQITIHANDKRYLISGKQLIK
jgi:hypothetical protein